MAKRIPDGIFFADDKDIQDLLLSSKLGKGRLLQIAQRRGIVLPKDDSREQIISAIARMPHDWSQLSDLLDQTSTAERSDKRSMAVVPGEFTADELHRVIDQLKDDRMDSSGEQWSVVQSGKNQIMATAAFAEVDPSKTRLAQRVQREISIEIEKTSSGLQVRHSARERGTEIIQDLVARLQESRGQKISATIIDLSTVLNPEFRTDFFIKLGHGISGYRMDETLSVRGSRMSVSEESEPSDEELESQDFAAAVRKIILTGRKVDQSPEYRRFAESKFFVSEMTWTAIDDHKEGLKVEFEAGFAADESAQRFSYAVKRIWERNSNGEFKKGYIRASGDRLRVLNQALEAAALRAQQEVFAALNPANTAVVSDSQPKTGAVGASGVQKSQRK